MHANSYYVYMYLRESDNTPYYIGKGTGNRMFSNDHSVNSPKNLDLIQIIKDGLDDQSARDLEIALIKQYGRKNNNTGILRNLTDGGEGRPGKNSAVGETRRQIKAEERLARAKIKEQEKVVRELKRAERVKLLLDNKEARRTKREEKEAAKKEANRQASEKRSLARKEERFKKDQAHVDELIELGKTICPCCGVRPVAINYYKYGRVYYRNKCGQCYRKKKKPMAAGWIKSGYKKTEKCEKCGFKFKHQDQAHIYHLDGNVSNNDWMNLKTICANCSIEISNKSERWKPTKLRPDF